MHITRSNPSQLSLLESAVSFPQNHKHYGETNIFKLAGILAEKIILTTLVRMAIKEPHCLLQICS
jgi:hypothetical protein